MTDAFIQFAASAASEVGLSPIGFELRPQILTEVETQLDGSAAPVCADGFRPFEPDPHVGADPDDLRSLQWLVHGALLSFASGKVRCPRPGFRAALRKDPAAGATEERKWGRGEPGAKAGLSLGRASIAAGGMADD